MAETRQRLLALLETPLAKRLLEDDRVMKVLIGLVGARGKVKKATDRRVAAIAKRLKLATAAEVSDLRRTIEELENRIAAKDA